MPINLELLTEEQCERVHTLIYHLKEYWIPRGPYPFSFFTIGAASYLDFSHPPQPTDRYYEYMRRYNPLLKQHFAWLHELVKTTLEAHLQTPVSYTEDFALPGFHVWLSPAIFTKSGLTPHFDLQYQTLPWKGDVDFNRVVSFTLAIRLPAGGGGLDVWDITYSEYMKAYNKGMIENTTDVTRFKKKIFYPYTVGKLAVHMGFVLHRVAPVAEVQADDERVTLQGHALWTGNQWTLYW